jgi:hypothetical protein
MAAPLQKEESQVGIWFLLTFASVLKSSKEHKQVSTAHIAPSPSVRNSAIKASVSGLPDEETCDATRQVPTSLLSFNRPYGDLTCNYGQKAVFSLRSERICFLLRVIKPTGFQNC